MRRGVALLAAALVVGTALPSTGQPSAGAGAGQLALGVWIEMHGNGGTMYAADGMRIVHEGELLTLGGVAKGKCTKTKADGWTMVLCIASGRIKELDLDQFQVDPALRDASLRMEHKGFRHKVDWTSEPPPEIGQGAAAGEWGVFAGVDAYTWADAEAKLFGKKMRKRCDFCVLAEGAAVGVFTAARQRLELDTVGDRFTVTYRIKTRA